MNRQTLELFKSYGRDPISYTGLQPGMFQFQTSFGFIAYAVVGNRQIVLGPPVCDPSDKDELLRRYLDFSTHAVFCYVDKQTAEYLNSHDYFFAAMGVDRRANNERLLRHPGRELSSAHNKANRRGFCLRELDIHRNRAAIQQINRDYFQRAQCSFELKFMNRPMDSATDGLRRYYGLYKYDEEHQGLFGYVALNPYFHQAELKGYLLDVIRFRNTRLWGVWLSTVRELAGDLHAHNLQLSLGYCMFKDVEKNPGNSTWLDTQVRCLRRLLHSSRYVKQLDFLKSRIPGDDEVRFFCSRRRSVVKPFYCLIKASGLNLNYMLGPELLRSVGQGLFNRNADEYSPR